MQKYMGTKIIEAELMTLGEYNKFKGWTLPPDESPDTKGYRVRYNNSYISWSPLDVFEASYKKINGDSVDLVNDLRNSSDTYILKDQETFNASHVYTIHDTFENVLAGIHFQEGPVKEFGLNGIAVEDLIIICISRLESFQNSIFHCRENELSMAKLEEGLMWLNKRTMNRVHRKVEGTSNK